MKNKKQKKYPNRSIAITKKRESRLQLAASLSLDPDVINQRNHWFTPLFDEMLENFINTRTATKAIVKP